MTGTTTTGGIPQGRVPQGGAPQGRAPQGGTTTQGGAAPQGPQTRQGGTPAPPPPAAYIRQLFTADTPPAPQGTLASELHKTTTLLQKQIAEEFYTLLTDQTRSLLELNMGQVHTVALAIVPKSSSVRVLYGFNCGTAPLRQASSVKNKLLALYGEGGRIIGAPDAMVLEQTMRDLQNCLIPSDQVTQQELTRTNGTFGKFLCKPSTVSTKEDIMSIAPIPAFLVYDGLLQDLSAAEVYERVLQCTYTSPMMTHLQTFLRAALVGDLRQADKKPFLPHNLWDITLPLEARIWKKERSDALFPDVFKAPLPPIPGGPPPTGAQSDQVTAKQLLEILRMQMTQAPTSNSSFQEEKKEDGVPATTKVSALESEIMKILCGEDPLSDNSVLPQWCRDMFNPNQDDKDKNIIIARALSGSPRFDNAKVPLYPELKNTIRKRNWAAGEEGCTPRFACAGMGLTVFAMLDLTEDEIAQMELESSAFSNATTTTTADQVP